MEYTLQDYCNRIREDVKDYDYILIGLGDEALNNNDGNLIDMLNKFGELLDKNNYFIISSTKHNYLGESTINPKRMVCPYINEDEKQWDFYNKWLSATLAKKLLVIEIGEGFNIIAVGEINNCSAAFVKLPQSATARNVSYIGSYILLSPHAITISLRVNF